MSRLYDDDKEGRISVYKDIASQDSVRWYMIEAGKFDLLTREEEQEQGKKQEEAWRNLYLLCYFRLHGYYKGALSFTREIFCENSREYSNYVYITPKYLNAYQKKDQEEELVGDFHPELKKRKSIFGKAESYFNYHADVLGEFEKKLMAENPRLKWGGKLQGQYREAALPYLTILAMSYSTFKKEVVDKFGKDMAAYKAHHSSKKNKQKGKITGLEELVSQELISPEFLESFNGLSKNLSKANSVLNEAEKYLNVISNAKNTLVKHNLRLVINFAKNYIRKVKALSYLDLIEFGNLGLMKAAEKFDYTRGLKFSTYATWWIRQAITRSIADYERIIRIPVHMFEHYSTVMRAESAFLQKQGRDPTVEELSAEAKLGQATIRQIQRIRGQGIDNLIRLDDDISSEKGTPLSDMVADKGALQPETEALNRGRNEKVRKILTELKPKEEQVLRLRFGIGGGPAYTLEEIGQMYHLTRERIRQIELKALEKLRRPLRKKPLEEYMLND